MAAVIAAREKSQQPRGTHRRCARAHLHSSESTRRAYILSVKLHKTRPRRDGMSPIEQISETGGGVASARARKLALAADTFGGRVMTKAARA